jgi:hypothetical protein
VWPKYKAQTCPYDESIETCEQFQCIRTDYRARNNAKHDWEGEKGKVRERRRVSADTRGKRIDLFLGIRLEIVANWGKAMDNDSACNEAVNVMTDTHKKVVNCLTDDMLDRCF